MHEIQENDMINSYSMHGRDKNMLHDVSRVLLQLGDYSVIHIL
jgi:hypothetical protein